MKKLEGTKLEILQSFGYELSLPLADNFLYAINSDSFYLGGFDPEELISEAYEYLQGEVSPGMYEFPQFDEV